MCEKVNSSAHFEALTRAKQLEVALRTNFGEEHLHTAKLLLANPVFRVFVKMAGSLTFESYVQRFFSICVSLSTVVNFHYYCSDAPEKQSFKFEDDVLCTGAHTAWHMIRSRLSEMGLLKAMARTLPIVSIYKVTDKTFSEINLKFKRVFRKDQFDKVVLPVIREHKPKTYAMLEEAAEDEMLYLDFVFRCFTALREMVSRGEVEIEDPEEPDLLPELDLNGAVAALGKSSFRVPDEPQYAFISVMLKNFPDYRAVCKDGYITVSKPFDPFSIIGGSIVDFAPLRTAKYVLRNSGEKTEVDGLHALGPEPKPVPVKGPREKGTPESFVLDHFGFDINMPEYSKVIFGNDPDVEIAVRGMSKTSHQWVKKWLPAPQDIGEAIESAVGLLKGKLKNLSDDQMRWAAAGRILAMKGNLIVDGHTIRRK